MSIMAESPFVDEIFPSVSMKTASYWLSGWLFESSDKKRDAFSFPRTKHIVESASPSTDESDTIVTESSPDLAG